MAIEDDGDIVRGLGFVALSAGYLEEQIDDLLIMLGPVVPFTAREQRWGISRKIGRALEVVQSLQFEYKDDSIGDLQTCSELFERRNEFIHGRIYGGLYDRPDTLKSGRPALQIELSLLQSYTALRTNCKRRGVKCTGRWFRFLARSAHT